MQQPFDALVTGFVKARPVAEQAMAPLRRLRQEGLIRSIHYVTWAGEEYDSAVAPIAAMPDVITKRVVPPDVQGTRNQRGVTNQVKNFEAALECVPDDKALILKTRPDYVMDTAFLRRKLSSWEQWGQLESRMTRFGVEMPAHVFENKVWVPWADTNQPFFYEDATFAGRRRDVRRFMTPLSPFDFKMLADEDCGHYAHVLRFIKSFTSRYPLFNGFVRNYHLFSDILEYRKSVIPLLVEDGFFWHVLVAHLWILHSHFHVDAGRDGEVNFYTNGANKDADWSKLDTLVSCNPYSVVEKWRESHEPGLAMPTMKRFWGRLMDDKWLKAFFTQPMPDMPDRTLGALIENIANHADGRLFTIEREFYAKLARHYRDYVAMQAVSLPAIVPLAA